MRSSLIAAIGFATVVAACGSDTPPERTDVAVVTISTAPTPTAPSPPTDGGPTPTGITTTLGKVFDASRDRPIPYRIFAPASATAAAPVAIISHGGEGSDVGYLSGAHIGRALADAGFVAVHIGHVPSAPGARPALDRPADVTFLLDRLADETVTVPGIEVDLGRVGVAGHSFGAYTAHAVAGADYGRSFLDNRVDAIAPISPQGPEQFGAFDHGPADNTWVSVEVPVLVLVGGDEINSNAIDSIVRPGWRLIPFTRYPGTADTIESIVAGQVHSDMWRTGSADVKRYVAQSITDFFSVYVAGNTTIKPCSIAIADTSFATIERNRAKSGSALADC